MKAIEQLIQFRQWLEKADDNSLDAFASQNQHLVLHFAEMWQRFSAEIPRSHSMPIVKPSEITPIQPKVLSQNLPNAKQDETYLVKVENYVVNEVIFGTECGLSWDKTQQHIAGVPTISGDVQLTFLLEEGSSVQASLFINPNPKRLWNNIPSDRNTRFWKADCARDYISTPNGCLLAARQRGRSHAHKGTCCDDDFMIAYHQDTGIYLLAVSDGAGSAEFSRQGSKVAVEAVKDKIWELLDLEEKSYKNLPHFLEQEKQKVITDALLTQAVKEAYYVQEKVARDADIPLKSLACTLLIALTLPQQDGRWLTVCYWVGDGAAAIFDPALSQVKLLGEVDSGQYSGETQFLTATEAHAEQVIARIRSYSQDYPPLLMLMTDGVSDPKFQTDAKLQTAEAWQQLWQELAEPLQEEDPALALENWLDFFSKGEHDDRTLAMFIPTSVVRQFVKNSENVTACPEQKVEGEAQAELQAVTNSAEFAQHLERENPLSEGISLIKESDNEEPCNE